MRLSRDPEPVGWVYENDEQENHYKTFFVKISSSLERIQNIFI